MMLTRLTAHAKRVSYHFGRRVKLGRERFRARGYHPSQLDFSDRHEPYLGAVLKRLLSAQPGAFIDVGANVGQTLMKVLQLDRCREYVGFEPQVGCCYFIDQFLRLNGLNNATVLPIGLSDSNRIATLYSDGQYDVMASITGDHDVTGKRRTDMTRIQTRIGDEVLRELGVYRVSVIKIDVEGAELQVLTGLKDTLRALCPSVIFEVLPNFYGCGERRVHSPEVCARNRISAGGVKALFDELGYDVFQLGDASNETKIEQFQLDDRDGFAGTNFLARPRGSRST